LKEKLQHIAIDKFKRLHKEIEFIKRELAKILVEIERIEAEIQKINEELDKISEQGVDFKVTLRDGDKTEELKMSELTTLLYEHTRAFRKFTPDEQHEITLGMMEFFRFFAFAFRYKLLTLIGFAGVFVIIKLIFEAIDYVDIFKLLH
jgi:Skp family chaperone for outer membrane proteins